MRERTEQQQKSQCAGEAVEELAGVRDLGGFCEGAAAPHDAEAHGRKAEHNGQASLIMRT